ncbi:MAG TPA: beta-galactosidase [Armatimonadota bacterium]|nr:beta-galactosidase [Armatimonadota bacterium]
MKRILARAAICLLLLCIAISAACAGKIGVRDPLRLSDDQTLKAIYYFPHWWDPWKTDDAAVTADLRKMREIGFNTLCLDHEVSQAVDRAWYWLDREYKLAGQEKMFILPWLQLQAVDRAGLMKFSHFQLKPAVNQDKQPEEDCVVYRDGEFRRALTHYITVYLDRYADHPALLRINDRGKLRPVVGLMVETGWRSSDGLALSFDEETNAYFRKWMRASYHDLNQLNSKWGTNYKSFDEIDPCDKTIFNYAFEDKNNMPMAVREHVLFRARLINDALRDVAKQVRKRHKDVLFVAEVAYPFSIDHPDANVYRWNNANEYKAVEFADIVFIRTVGLTSSGAVAKEQEVMMLNGKRLILAYRFFGDSTPQRAVAFALDCATCANGLAYYNWNETADASSAIYDKPDRQALLKLLGDTYDMLCDVGKRYAFSVPAPAASPESAAPPESVPADVAPAPVVAPQLPAESLPATAPVPPSDAAP